MKLPGADRLFIDERKVRDYLLSPLHPVGRFKARLFFALGYSREEWQVLQNDLRKVAEFGEATQGQQSTYGRKSAVN